MKRSRPQMPRDIDVSRMEYHELLRAYDYYNHQQNETAHVLSKSPRNREYLRAYEAIRSTCDKIAQEIELRKRQGYTNKKTDK